MGAKENRMKIGTFFSRGLSSLVLSMVSVCLMASDDFATEPLESITFEELSKSDYTDHVIAFDKVFSVVQVDSFLEFGLGRATKYFLDKAPLVVSLEMASTYALQQSLQWYKICVKKFMPFYTNWRPTFRFCSEEMDRATTDAAIRNVFPESLSPSYEEEIADICTQGLSFCGGKCTVAFIDSGPYGRVDLVNEMLSRNTPIVAAHDTVAEGWARYFYGYKERLKVPENYVAITFRVRAGVTFWINKDVISQDVIAYLQQEASQMKP